MRIDKETHMASVMRTARVSGTKKTIGENETHGDRIRREETDRNRNRKKEDNETNRNEEGQ